MVTPDMPVASAGPNAAVLPCPLQRHAIEAQVTGVDGAPLANVAVELKQGNHAMLRDLSKHDGLVRFDGLAGGAYMLSLYELDEDAWSLTASVALAPARAHSSGDAPWQAPAPPAAAEATVHTIAEGESTLSLSELHGHDANTIWNDGANAALRHSRREMNALAVGDRLAIPARRPRGIAAATGNRYLLTRHGIPAIFRLQVLVGAEPIGDCPFLLTIDERLTLDGRTDKAGILAVHLPAQSRAGTLELKSESYWKSVTLQLHFGTVGAVEEDAGLASRLANLGMLANDATGARTGELAQAIARFQAWHELPITGNKDDDTVARLYEAHDLPMRPPTSA